MPHPLDLSIARLYDASGTIAGAGFLVGDRNLLTCAHVIVAAGIQVVPTKLPSVEVVRLDFPLLTLEKTCFARICFWDEDKDIAGLELTSDPPAGASVARLLDTNDVWDHRFRTFGFPEHYDDGIWASGLLKGRTGGKVIQFEDVKETGYQVQPGFSGSPVWDESLGGVIGMVSSSDTDKKAKVAYCIPYDVLSTWDQIADKAIQEKTGVQLFMCYKRDAEPDQRIVEYLAKKLDQQGHTVFTDTTMRTGENWLDRINAEIKKSDFLVVFISNASANSEMVQSEIRRAYEFRKLHGHPQILPIRVAYHDLLPYSIDAFLNPLQYVLWDNEADTERLLQELNQAIHGNLPIKPPMELQQPFVSDLSEDGRVLRGDILPPPLPEFDPRYLDELDSPGGAVKIRDNFYVERDADARLKSQVVRSGTTVTVRAARQTGKSSLLIRGIQHAKKTGSNIVHLDMQRVDSNHLASIENFTRYLAEYIVFKLKLNADEIERHRRKGLSPQENLSNFLEDYVFEKFDQNILLAIDEIDRLLQTDFYSEFFALLRSWHNNRASDERWDKLNIAMVISTEPYLLIPDNTQSPFNVGMNLYLEDFKADQVQALNIKHGSPVGPADFQQMMDLLGGHPYLTRKALYALVTEKITWGQFMKTAKQDHGPFGDHLRRFHWLIRDDEKIKEALRLVIRSNQCPEEMVYRLLQAGLVKASGNVCKCRCDLYRDYFENKL
jgi:hypothetical protein